MIIEGILGTALGGVFRLAPELLKHFDRKNERSHELELLKAQIAADAAKAEQNLRAIDASISVAEMQGLVEASKAQQPVIPALIGNKWVDALIQLPYAVANVASMLVRPMVTYWLFALYSLAKYALFVSLTQHQSMDWAAAALAIWGADDMALLCSVCSYWFLDRSLRKMGKD